MRRASRVLALFGVPVVVAALGSWWPGVHVQIERLGAAPAIAWVVSGAGLLISYWLRTGRLCEEWPQLRLDKWQAFRIVMLHNAAVLLLPLRAGEAGYPLLLQRRFGIPLAESTASLVCLRLQDAIVLGLLVVFAVAPVGMAPLLFVALLSTLAMLAVVMHRLAAPANPRATSEQDDLRAARILRACLQALLGAARRLTWRSWFWSLGNWFAKGAALGVLLACLLGQPWPGAMGAALVGEAGAALPLQVPAGFGAYEAGVWLGARQASWPLPAGLVLGAALVVHVFALCVGLACAAACLVVAGSGRLSPQAD